MSKISVTGSSGFIGSWLCRLLSIPKDRQYDLNRKIFEHEMIGDVTNPTIQVKIAKTSDTVVHLAALSGVRIVPINPQKP